MEFSRGYQMLKLALEKEGKTPNSTGKQNLIFQRKKLVATSERPSPKSKVKETLESKLKTKLPEPGPNLGPKTPSLTKRKAIIPKPKGWVTEATAAKSKLKVTSIGPKPQPTNVLLPNELEPLSSLLAAESGIVKLPDNNTRVPVEDRIDLPPPCKKPRTAQQQKLSKMMKYPLLAPCKDTCRKKCSGRFSNDHREVVNSSFWSMSFGERRTWFDSHITVMGVKRHRPRDPDTQKKKNHYLAYKLTANDGQKVLVCKIMFLRTLGLKTDGMVTEFVKAKSESPGTVPVKDGRGVAPAVNKGDWNSVKKHINSYHPQVSHYTKEHAPHRRYLDSHLTKKGMWEDYKAAGGELSYSVYLKAFKEEKITIGHPSQDQCDVCGSYENHAKERGDGHNGEACETCIDGKRHLARAKLSRHEYQKISQGKSGLDNVSAFAADMQKVVLLPKLETKEHFFISRLVVFNETFASLTDKDRDYVILWHEAIAGRSASEVASSYVKCLSQASNPEVLFWVDNCSAQNKNWTLFRTLVSVVNSEWGPEKVVMKYLERGHTFMKADSIHGLIGTKMKRRPEILSFNDFADLCDSAGRKIKVVKMQVNDFYSFTPGQRSRQTKKVSLPLLNSLVEVQFEKGSREMKYKTSFEQDIPLKVDFLKPKATVDMPEKHREPRGISSEKKKKIVKLLQTSASVSFESRKFWFDLPVSDTSNDLVDEVE